MTYLINFAGVTEFRHGYRRHKKMAGGLWGAPPAIP
jgi:hypothetical protein